MYSLWNSPQLVDIKYAFSMHRPSRSWIDKMHDSGTYSYFNDSIQLSSVAARSFVTDSLSSLQVQFNSSFVSLGSIVSLESALHAESCILTQSAVLSNSPKELVIPELISDMTNARFDAAFKVMQYLGGGAFGRVFKAEVKETKEEVVIKFLKRETAELPDEVKFMRQLCHPNIVEYRCVSANMEYVQIVMSCHGQMSTSFETYKSCLSSFSEAMLTFFARQILAGINYIHREGVAHMDLKEANVIINDKLQIKIIDFGLSIQALDPGFHRPKYDSFGTSLYMSPELHFRRGYYGREADMWAFGVLLYRTFTGSFPFKLNGRGRLIPPNRYRCRPIGRPCSRGLKNFFWQLFNSDGGRRISAAQAMRHPWLERSRLTNIKEEYYHPFLLM